MEFSYNPLLVVLSVVVAIQASYVGLSLARHIPGAFASGRRLLVAGAALSLATGIWGMHFIGMLAIKTAGRIDYDLLLTLISFLACVLVVGIAIYLASLRAQRMTAIAAIVMGCGIVAMHYIGMAAVHASVHMAHDPAFALASLFIAVVASGLALWLAFSAQRRPPMLVCAAVLGCAISGMHYTAMAGMNLQSMPGMPDESGPAISGDLLALVVSVVAFSISGIFMLTLVPMEGGETGKWKLADEPAKLLAEVEPPEPETVPVAPEPLASLPEPEPAPEKILPFEKNGSRFHVAASEIISVHANAHYTYLFNGRDDLFCPLSITEIASRLPVQTWFRTHRSYIVNLEHVIQVRKLGDAGVAELDSPIRRTVPVSRTRLGMLRKELAAIQARPANLSA